MLHEHEKKMNKLNEMKEKGYNEIMGPQLMAQ